MIIKIIKNSFLIFTYHILLIALPINFFLIGLKVPLFIDLLPWIFYPFLFFSPILTVLLSIHSTPANKQPFGWIFPIVVSFVGYTPIILSFFFITSLTNIRDCILILSFPILIGLVAFWGSRLLTLSRHSLFNNARE